MPGTAQESIAKTLSAAELEEALKDRFQERFVPDTVAAPLIGTTPATLRRWRHEERGPRYVKIGSNVRYKITDLEQWVAQRTVETRESAPCTEADGNAIE
jgi:predicted DNA-binding transcriptional regulator AlpA